MGTTHKPDAEVVPKQRRRDLRGQLSLRLVDRTRATLGKMLGIIEARDGLHLDLELAPTRARDLLADLARGEEYYLEPMFGGPDLVALTVSALESWTQARLRPDAAPAPVAAPIAPRPSVNLAPIVPIVWSPRR